MPGRRSCLGPGSTLVKISARLVSALAYGSPESQDSYPYACILPVSRDLSVTSLHPTRILGLLDVSLVLPDSQEFFNT